MRNTSPSVPASFDRQVRHLISQRKRVSLRRLRPTTSFAHELLFDLVDVVDIILAVERRFHLTIPDEVPLHTVGDLLRYVSTHHASAAQA